jgi:hypothetical protein
MKLNTRGVDVAYAIGNEEAFTTHGALSAVRGAVTYTGSLPGDWGGVYASFRRTNEIRYTVLSYETPIAWVTTSGDVYLPSVKYSRTTSAHQGRCYRLANLGKRVIRELSAMADFVPPQSGEAALYSLEYLKMKTPAASS